MNEFVSGVDKPDAYNLTISELEQQLSERFGEKAGEILASQMSQAWINFARYGNPNHDGLPHWPAFTP